EEVLNGVPVLKDVHHEEIELADLQRLIDQLQFYLDETKFVFLDTQKTFEKISPSSTNEQDRGNLELMYSNLVRANNLGGALNRKLNELKQLSLTLSVWRGSSLNES